MDAAVARVWNEACDLALDFSREGVRRSAPAGMVHLSELLWIDSAAMGDGLEYAVQYFDPERFEAAAIACDYFQLTAAATLMRRLAGSGGDLSLAARLNSEYLDATGQRGPGESGIEAALARKLRDSPEDFE